MSATKPTIHREICGTATGYRAHSKRGEKRCSPCRVAWAERCRQYTPQTRPSAQEVADEIKWMLSLNQGHHYILNAIGYTGRTQALEKRMRDNGHIDIVRWVAEIDRTERNAA